MVVQDLRFPQSSIVISLVILHDAAWGGSLPKNTD